MQIIGTLLEQSQFHSPLLSAQFLRKYCQEDRSEKEIGVSERADCLPSYTIHQVNASQDAKKTGKPSGRLASRSRMAVITETMSAVLPSVTSLSAWQAWQGVG